MPKGTNVVNTRSSFALVEVGEMRQVLRMPVLGIPARELVLYVFIVGAIVARYVIGS